MELHLLMVGAAFSLNPTPHIPNTAEKTSLRSAGLLSPCYHLPQPCSSSSNADFIQSLFFSSRRSHPPSPSPHGPPLSRQHPSRQAAARGRRRPWPGGAQGSRRRGPRPPAPRRRGSQPRSPPAAAAPGRAAPAPGPRPARVPPSSAGQRRL